MKRTTAPAVDRHAKARSRQRGLELSFAVKDIFAKLDFSDRFCLASLVLDPPVHCDGYCLV